MCGPASYCAYASLRHFFLQKKHITAIIWFGLAVLTQISLRETSDNPDVMSNSEFGLNNSQIKI